MQRAFFFLWPLFPTGHKGRRRRKVRLSPPEADLGGLKPEQLPKDAALPVVDQEQNIRFAAEHDKKAATSQESKAAGYGTFVAEKPKGEYADEGRGIIGKLMWLGRTGWFFMTVAIQMLSREIQTWSAEVDVQCRRIMAHIRTYREGVLLLRTAPRDFKEKALKLLVHPNIVRYLGIERDDGRGRRRLVQGAAALRGAAPGACRGDARGDARGHARQHPGC